MEGAKMLSLSRPGKGLASVIIFLLFVSGVSAQKNKTKNLASEGRPVLWEQVNIRDRDLYLGPGSSEMRPNLRNITFLEEEKDGGYSKKYRIKDGSGKTWVAKVGKEAQSETASVRLVWALGYKTEINYLVPSLTIPGKGTFANVRLEARPDRVKRLENWKWKSNPFVGTREFTCLKIMMAFLNNWDLKDTNNKILFEKDSGDLDYVISDLGATLGKTGGVPFFWRITRSRNAPRDYSGSKMLNKVRNGDVKFTYGGKMREIFNDITVADAQWLTHLLMQLSDRQIEDAFRAANYSRSDILLLRQAVKSRIRELNVSTRTVR
jgi:hypothetical protein